MQNSTNSFIVDLLSNRRIFDAYKLSRFMYRVGSSIIDDASYAQLEELIKKLGVGEDYLNRSYDDDPIPMTLIDEFKLHSYLPDFESHGSKYDDYLDSEKSMSIRAVETRKDVYEFCLATRGLDKTLAVKINGVNIKGYISKEDGEEHSTLKVARTRGRNGDSFNVTRNMLRVFNENSNLQLEGAKVTGEAFVSLDGMKRGLFSPNGTKMKVSRSAALSMLRTDFKDEDYKYLRYMIFDIDGMSNNNYENLYKLKEMGFDVAPTILIKSDEIPLDDYDEFCVWLQGHMDYFYQVCKDNNIPADGLVMDVNDRNFTGEVNGQYSDKNIALKFDYWSHKYYKGVVKEILMEQRAKVCSVRASIEPLITEDNSTARTVNLHSLSIMVSSGIRKGSAIYFKRDSEVYNNLVYGTELIELIGDDNVCKNQEVSPTNIF